MTRGQQEIEGLLALLEDSGRLLGKYRKVQETNIELIRALCSGEYGSEEVKEAMGRNIKALLEVREAQQDAMGAVAKREQLKKSAILH